MAQPPSPDERTMMAPPAGAPPPKPKRDEGLGHNALPKGTKLGEFEIQGLVGEGGFGIVYLAYDHSLDRKIALKEYMPAELAQRQGFSVAVRSPRHAETFAAGMKSFINEAKLLAQFDHPSLVKVYRFWEGNGTAYMVMPFYEGDTLKQALKAFDGKPDEAWLTSMLAQLLGALDVIHGRQCYHRDIAPDNIILLPGHQPLLLDFGAARRVIGDMTQALTVILKPGYAPIEQYAEADNMRQGPWTDLYALASVIYAAIVGKAPVPAVARIMSDPIQPLAQACAGQYSDTFLKAIDSAMAVRPEDRPQSVAEFRRLLGLSEREPTGFAGYEKAPGEAATLIVPPSVKAAEEATSKGHKPILIGAAVLGGLAIAGGAYFAMQKPAATDTTAAPAAQTKEATAAIKPQPAPPPAGASAKPDCTNVERYCDVVSALAAFSGKPGSLRIALKNGGKSVPVGGKLVVDVAGPDFPAFVYADLYDPEGKVVHLLPNVKDKRNQFQPGQRMVLGEDPLFGVEWDILPPLGQHLLVVVASRERILDGKQGLDDAKAYARAIQDALKGKAAGEAAVYYTPIDVVSKK